MINENIIDSVKGAAWQMKKPEVKKEMVTKLADLIIKKLSVSTNKEDLEAGRKSIESTANSILRWPDRDNIRQHALSIAKKYHGCNFNQVFFVLRNSLDKVKKGSIVTEEDDYLDSAEVHARQQEEGTNHWFENVYAAVEKVKGRKLTQEEKKKIRHEIEFGDGRNDKWANYFDKSDNQAAINKFAQIQDIIKEEIFNY